MNHAPVNDHLRKSLRNLHMAHRFALDLGYSESVLAHIRHAITETHRALDGIPSRETASEPLQSIAAASASATPYRSEKTACEAPAGLGAPFSGSRDGSSPANPSASRLTSRDATNASQASGEGASPRRLRARSARAGAGEAPIP